jgi:alpha-1,3-rhamnosyl/mannosyltransferase
LPAAKLEVVYNGCDFQGHDSPPAEAPPREPVPAEFLLFVGSLEPGKNLALLKSAYAVAGEQGQRLPPLVIVGARWEGLAHEGPPPADWHYLGRQPDEALVYLYRRALALVYPSKYEGFGLPVAEAMALGCPVVCSPVSSLPEVGGDAALFVDADPSAYVAAIRRLVSQSGERDEMRRRGLVQSRKFTWDRCAEGTLAVYRGV